MIIDCDECAARGPGCGDCVVSVLLGGPPEEQVGGPESRGGSARRATGRGGTAMYAGDSTLLELDETERWAVHNLAASGLVPPLRMVPVQATLSTQREANVTARRRSAG